MFRPKLLYIAAAILLSQGAQANGFSNTHFFGDSLTDSGSFGFKFTTNPGPVWSETIAKNFGIELLPANQGGNNFAEGGARVSGLPGIGAGPASTATPVMQQVQAYLNRTGNTADANALYSVWAGANDIFWLAGGNEADIPAYIRRTIGEHVAAIGMLRTAGAKYIVVPLIPDIGTSPFGISRGASGSSALTQLTETYNTNLMLALQAQGITVIPADTFSLLREVQANPTMYGFENITDLACGANILPSCIANVTVPAGRENSYLFADGVHPTSGGHQVVSDYIQSLLYAPNFTSEAARVSMLEQRAISVELDHQSSLALQTDMSDARFWISGSTGEQNRHSPQGVSGSPYRLGVGLDRHISDNAVLGFALHQSRNNASLSSGKVSNDGTSFSIYGARIIENWRVNGSVSVAKNDFDLLRSVKLGPAIRDIKANTEGIQLTAQVSAQYHFESENISHGPLFGLRMQLLSMDNYTENSATGSSTALNVDPAHQRETTGFVGWKINGKYSSFKPHATLLLESRLNNSSSATDLSLVNIPGQRFSLPSNQPDKHYGTLILGSDFELSSDIRLGVQLNHVFNNTDMDETRVNLTASVSF